MRLESLSVSTNLRQKAPLIVRLGRHHFASLHVAVLLPFALINPEHHPLGLRLHPVQQGPLPRRGRRGAASWPGHVGRVLRAAVELAAGSARAKSEALSRPRRR